MSLSSSLNILTTPDTYLNLVQANLKQQLDPTLAQAAAGFPSVIGPAVYASASATTGGVAGQISAQTGFIGWGWVSSHAGSVIGVSCRMINTVADTTGISVFKNGTLLWNAGTVVAVSGSQGAVTAALGAHTFAAGDRLSMSFTWSVAGLAPAALCYITVALTP